MGQNHVHRDRKPNRAARHSDDMSDEELEDVDDKLQAFIDEERKRQRRVKFHILRRQMTPPGAPPRKLTWDAIEQIRYLKQEQPEDWTVERLAQGFSVTPDVILRVLRSQFVPGPARKVKQDAKVMAELNQQGLLSGARTGQDRLKLQGNRTPAALSPGSKEDALVPVADKTLMIRGEGSGSLAKSPSPVTVLPTQFKAGISKDATLTRATGEGSTANTYPTPEEDEEEESWDGQVLTEEELERFMEMERPSLPVQVGNDFFDTEGNFLYRI
ncbi:neugrin isoform X2 [Mastacembelus armatus]|nr:neugrin isoform X2 [Mastacembelus armatus]